MTTISLLSPNEIKFVKTISFSKSIGGIPHFAKIIYTRKPSSEYQMKQDDTSFKRLYYGIKEEAYPKDTIDEFILYAIKNIYTDAIVRSSILMFNTELDNYKRILPQFCKNRFVIQINPHIDIDQAMKSGKNEWSGYFINLELFCYPSEKEVFQNSLSILEYNIDKETEFLDFFQKLEKQVEPIL
jgi:hypothetical protein